MPIKTILIIDDDEMLRQTLARGLRAEGFAVLSADSAESGAEVLARVRPDAIVLDRMMTGMDGLTFLKKIRDAGDTIPVLMLTAMTGAENAVGGLSGGADDYLGKPFQLKELSLRLKNLTKKSAAPTSALPDGLVLAGGEFFVDGKLFALSAEENRLLTVLVSPIGTIAAAKPMVAKRLRTKLNGVSLGMDMATVRGKGYKIVVLNK